MIEIEIQLRITELESRYEQLRKRPKRCQYGDHEYNLYITEGEICGLKWVLAHCFNQSEPNVIEQ